MKNHFKVFRYFLCLSVLLLTSFNLQSQPNLGYLSGESIETLDRVEREMEYWSDLSGVLIFGTVVSLAASEPVIIAAQLGVDLETPAEALKGIPQAQRARVSDIISLHIVENGNYFNEEERAFWNNFLELLKRPNSNIQIGKSYGDPHIVTYDGLRYRFQTVGEFILSRSTNWNCK